MKHRKAYGAGELAGGSEAQYLSERRCVLVKISNEVPRYLPGENCRLPPTGGRSWEEITQLR